MPRQEDDRNIETLLQEKKNIFKDEEQKTERRVICPLDSKHSVYEKNFQKHLLKCNSRIKHLGKKQREERIYILFNELSINH